MKISKKTYNLFCKYGSELLWVSDPIRESRPYGTNEETDEEFLILEGLDQSLELFYNKHYSEKLRKEYGNNIETLKTKVTDEVFNLMVNKYKNKSVKTKSQLGFIGRMKNWFS